MKASTLNTPSQRKVDPNRLADFVMMTQRSCILNLSSELNRGNISFPQFFLLTYLSSEDYLTMSAIAKKMGHSTAAATGLVDRLEKLGFVERVHAAEDRRKIMVRITSSGSEIVSTMRQHIASELANIMEDLDDVDASSVVAANQAIEGKNLES
ncbi:MarR family transcriptional regulator [Akkermansiaceae bacterium]|nr:MarR family transcriptional regulator [Akkermansiaceae bacterium]MDB4405075.1 MarR family transcriptional regulator [bacterium]MDA7509175.1 MarR family transcriptional regulator [Akkermansiaceae bacterium]MDA7527010.1 MarR family transcriptional regulator [Akkermansiaceae bacterium]MDA7539920.1 MarR family transcriptional regulator [Akkermansiaceae bacterium]|tara:strand:- start:349 stop:810 length:462 start_codon:yes stop_codon:yes gene_type:complete